MTKTFSECTGDMSVEFFTDWMQAKLLEMLTSMRENEAILEYRYELIAVDLMEAKTDDDLLALIAEMQIGLIEKKQSVLMDRMNRGLELMAQEKSEARRNKMREQYEKLDNEWKEMATECLSKTKYLKSV